MNGNPPVAAFYKDYRGYHGEHYGQNQKELQDVPFVRYEGIEIESLDGFGNPRDNAGKDHQRDAVSYSAFGDLLAQPHDEHGPGGERKHGQQVEADAMNPGESAGRRFNQGSHRDGLR